MKSSTHTIGVIGTGEIGWRIGKLLLAAGHEVIAYDNRPEALRRPKDSGFIVADSIADVCRRADIVLSCVTDGAALRDIVSGPLGIAANLQAGKPYIDTTSAEPWITQEVAPLLEREGIPFLDAPVSGGVPAAEAGRMNFMVGGDVALLNRCRSTLEVLGPVITHVGAVGTGHTVKAINMLALAASMLSTAELFAIGIDAGLSLNQLIVRLEAGIGGSYSTRVHFPRFIAPGNYASGFSFDLMLKDLSIGISLAERCGIPLFMERTTYEIYQRGANAGLAGKDNTRIVEHILSTAHVGRRNGGGQSDFLRSVEILAAACNTLVGAESICLGVAAGLSAKTVIEVISQSSGYTWALSNGIATYLKNATGNATTLAEIHRAAMSIMASARGATIPTPLVEKMTEIHTAAIRRFGENADGRMVLDLVAEWTKQGDAMTMMWEYASGVA